MLNLKKKNNKTWLSLLYKKEQQNLEHTSKPNDHHALLNLAKRIV